MKTGDLTYNVPILTKINVSDLYNKIDPWQVPEVTHDVVRVELSFEYHAWQNLYRLHTKIGDINIAHAFTEQMMVYSPDPIQYIAICFATYTASMTEAYRYAAHKAFEKFFSYLPPDLSMKEIKVATPPSGDFQGFLNEYGKNAIQSAYFNAGIVPAPTPSLSTMSADLPGVGEMVNHPITNEQGRLFNVIIDLNDNYRWTREQIADWIESLDIDINFKTKEPSNG